jgi:hypothetical protein
VNVVEVHALRHATTERTNSRLNARYIGCSRRRAKEG